MKENKNLYVIFWRTIHNIIIINTFGARVYGKVPSAHGLSSMPRCNINLFGIPQTLLKSLCIIRTTPRNHLLLSSLYLSFLPILPFLFHMPSSPASICSLLLLFYITAFPENTKTDSSHPYKKEVFMKKDEEKVNQKKYHNWL